MMIYWKRATDVYPDGGWQPNNAFMVFDPEVLFPRFYMEKGDETKGGLNKRLYGIREGKAG